jgi:hypothetical protein
VLENRVLRRIYGSNRGEVTGGLRKLHNEELRDLFSVPSILRIITQRIMRWARHVEGEGCWWEGKKARDHQEDLGVGGRLRLNWILEK